MATTNYKIFGESSTNVYTDTEYLNLAERVTGAISNTPISSKLINSALKSSTTICKAIVDLLSNTNSLGISSNYSTVLSAITSGLTSLIKTNTLFEIVKSTISNSDAFTFRWGNKTSAETFLMSNIIANKANNLVGNFSGAIPYQNNLFATEFVQPIQTEDSILISEDSGYFKPTWKKFSEVVLDTSKTTNALKNILIQSLTSTITYNSGLGASTIKMYVDDSLFTNPNYGYLCELYFDGTDTKSTNTNKMILTNQDFIITTYIDTVSTLVKQFVIQIENINLTAYNGAKFIAKCIPINEPNTVKAMFNCSIMSTSFN